MNSTDWEFSKEVEPDLIELLELVNLDENKKFQLETKVLELFPEYKDFQTNLEKSLSMLENKDSTKNVEVIVIDDDSNDNTNIGNNENKINIEIPDISTLNIQQTIKQSTEEQTNNADQFIVYMQERLENENTTLEKENLTKLINDFNKQILNYLFAKIYDLSDNGIYNLNKSLCTTDLSLNDIPQYFCKDILYKKLQNKNPSNKILTAMKDFKEKFSNVTKQELLDAFLVSDVENNNFYQIIINMFSQNEKLQFLRDFILTAHELELWQLSVLDSLLNAEIEDNIKRRLLNLMEISADKFKNEKLFMKLLTSIINILEANFEDQVQIISNIIEKNKTVNKVSAQKALKKWVNKFNSQDLL